MFKTNSAPTTIQPQPPLLKLTFDASEIEETMHQLTRK